VNNNMFGQPFGNQSEMRGQSGFRNNRNFGADNTDEYFRNDNADQPSKFASSKNKVSNTSKYARNNL
jgi:hypothetical protein